VTREKAPITDTNRQNTPTTVVAVARSEKDGTPVTLEVDGVLYERANQAEARKFIEDFHCRDQISAYGVPDELLGRFEMAIAGGIVDEWHENMRAIGQMLVYHGQHDLWQLAYLEYNQGSSYALGDETLFLLGQPTSGMVGYKGSPATRYNSATEQAAQLAERQG
jgi:hypothetical protein